MCVPITLSPSLKETFIFLRYAILGLSVLKCRVTVLNQAVRVAVSLWLLLTTLKTFQIFDHNWSKSWVISPEMSAFVGQGTSPGRIRRTISSVFTPHFCSLVPWYVWCHDMCVHVLLSIYWSSDREQRNVICTQVRKAGKKSVYWFAVKSYSKLFHAAILLAFLICYLNTLYQCKTEYWKDPKCITW